jgi:hypothetical protein
VVGRLGQRHADLLEAMLFVAERSRETDDGAIELLVDPAQVRRTLSGGERHLWRVRLGTPLVELMKRDLLLWYNPAPLARLQYGISQAVARHVLTHSRSPDKGWKLDGLIKVVCGVLGSQATRESWRAPPSRWAGQPLSLSQENLHRGGHYKVSNIDRIGQPRHAAKEEAWAVGARTSTEVAQKTGIHSFRTKEAYLKVWRQCLDHAKSTFRVGDIERLTGEHVSSFLRLRIDEDVGRQTYGQAASALGKLENALRSYAEAKGTGLS